MSEHALVSGAEPVPPCRVEGGRIAEDVACEKCGYNLRTQAPEGNCPECGEAIEQTFRIRSDRRFRPLTLLNFSIWDARVFYGIWGFGPPLVCFGLAYTAAFAGWPSNGVPGHAGVILGWAATVPIYPLAAWSLVSLGAILIRPTWAGERRWCRWGIVNGMMLAAVYLVLLWTAIALWYGMIASIVALAAVYGFLRVRLKLAQQNAGGFTKGKIAFLRIVTWWGLIGGLVSGALAVALFAGPLWTLLVFGLVHLRIQRTAGNRPPPSRPLLLGTLWGGAWFTCWTLAVAEALKAYA